MSALIGFIRNSSHLEYTKELAYHYFVFGLLLRSNLDLPGLVPVNSPASVPNITFHLGISPFTDGTIHGNEEALRYESPYVDDKGESILRIWRVAPGTHVRLAYCDGTQFWVDSAGTALWAVWPDSSSLENTASYLLGPVFGILLRLRGTICLHASAVSIGDRSIAFIGPQGAGKSTTAAAFVRLGYAAISDDIVALVEAGSKFGVIPSYPHIALCPDSADFLFGSFHALPQISSDWEKRRLALGSQGTRFEERSLPLGGIYVLGYRTAYPAPFVENMLYSEALRALVVNSYATNFLDRGMRAKEFKILGRLVARVPVRFVVPHHEPGRIDELCQLIREDLGTPEIGELLKLEKSTNLHD